jgi:hypothetical protein
LRKILYILRESLYLVRRERLWVLGAVFVLLAVVAFFVYQVTPITVVSFIYAGI